jgi:hypothetical protein
MSNQHVTAAFLARFLKSGAPVRRGGGGGRAERPMNNRVCSAQTLIFTALIEPIAWNATFAPVLFCIHNCFRIRRQMTIRAGLHSVPPKSTLLFAYFPVRLGTTVGAVDCLAIAW